MTDPLCTVPECGTPSPYAFLCPKHVRTLTKVLAELPSALQDLSVTIARQANAGGRGGGKAPKAADHPLPIDLRAAHLMDMVRNGLSTTIRGLCEDRGLPTPQLGDPMRPVTAAAMSRWLLAHVDSIAAGHTAGDIYAATLAIQRALKQAVDNHQKRWAGKCPVNLKTGAVIVQRDLILEVETPRKCDADLYTRPGVAVILCPECCTEIPAVDQMRNIIADAAEFMGTATFIANALVDAGYAVRATQISDMARRGKLFAWQEDDLGNPLYRLGDVVALLKAKDDERMAS